MRAIKVESEHRTCAREARVMRAMGGKEHFPELLLEGAHEGMPFLAMELVGENLADVRGRRAGQRFGQRTTAAIARALLDALESLHGEGYVHRDVKPGNVCLGNGKLGMKKLYLIDFGLARKFTDDDGKVLAERDEATFRGTTTYASPHAHAHKEQSARDDLYSVLYVVAEAHEGVLPWKAGEKLSKDDVEKEKQACAKDPRRLCPTQGCPPAIEKFARAIAKLKYGEKPNYAALRAPFEEVIRNSGGDESPLDWETQPVPASQPVPQPSPNRSAPPPPSGPIPPNATYADVAAQNITGRKRERENSERAAPAPQVHAEFVVNNQSSFWDAKPAWCQPWTIVSTGTVAIATPGALFHDGGWLVNAATVVVALGVSAWWFLFLWVVPREYDAHRGGPSSDADDDARG
ncbi:casein kinase [Ostreococcus tauri]|uniref:non-specific serine/threonine protein kinase n=1 Tax=Ostreococcus tauri TaxID=70448 RepID=A0A1Y5IDE3_OSTTA|nr:casein kinase [Ostreococcus tauri]